MKLNLNFAPLSLIPTNQWLDKTPSLDGEDDDDEVASNVSSSTPSPTILTNQPPPNIGDLSNLLNNLNLSNVSAQPISYPTPNYQPIYQVPTQPQQPNFALPPPNRSPSQIVQPNPVPIPDYNPVPTFNPSNLGFNPIPTFNPTSLPVPNRSP